MTVEISKELFDLIKKGQEVSNIKEYENYREVQYYNGALTCIVFERVYFISGTNYYLIDINA